MCSELSNIAGVELNKLEDAEIEAIETGKYKSLNIGDFKRFYIVSSVNSKFAKYSVVEFITCSYSGKCYLIEDVLSGDREWTMYYNVYPIRWKSHDFQHTWYYNLKLEKIIEKLFA